ncbi:MAG: DUF3488 domain-containing transglutaminase family protein [Bdellovibrionaceae bacterium]|nr:DUF3488 domain-containing transglutaminase family protein [Pseudobdellovibrionaceae bacterium]
MKQFNKTSRKFNLSLLVLIVLNLVPHLEDHLVVTLVLGGVALLWRVLYEYQKAKLPHFIVKFFMVVGASYLVYKIHGQITGTEAATALLIAGVCLKLIDNANYHDSMIILFLNFLLLMARFLVSQSLSMTLLGVLNLILVTALLVQLHKGRELQLNLKSLLKLGFKLFVQTAPLLILLFFVFPRFSTGFFQLNSESNAKTGFSPKLAPGEVSRLATSDELAFRVEFGKKIPQPKDRYWRGAILKVNQGMNWEIGDTEAKRNFEVTKKNSDQLIEQNIILEPRYGKWLFALETPISLKFKDEIKQMQSYQQEGQVYSIKRSNGQKIVYQVLSDLNPLVENESLGPYLQILEENNKSLKTLIENTLKSSIDELAIKQKYLDYFSKNIKYTLKPKALKTNTVSEFLFETRQGFCEHMAGSFAYLLRASGIPARVVVGFQGAVKNELGNHYTIKEKDAHAWVEMWSKSQERWLRVDPTEVVAPMRLELGGDVFHNLSEEELNKGLTQDEYMSMYKSTWYYRVVGQSQLAFDLASMKWNQFLLDFDHEGQKEFFRKLGISKLKSYHLGAISLFALLFFFLWINRLRYFKRPKESLEIRIYRDLCRQFSEKGVNREIYFGPKTYLNQCQKKWPPISEDLNQLTAIYESARYSRHGLSKQNEVQLKNLYSNIKAYLQKAS